MAEKITLHAKPRTIIGKKVRAIRVEGRMPIVVYGSGTEPVALEVETKAFGHVAHQAGATQLIQLEIDGESKPRAVLIRDVQQHVTRLTPIHADLIQVDLTQTIVASVPVVVTVMPKMAESGAGVLTLPVTELSVEALPDHLPQAIEIDASVLTDFDTSIKASDIDLGEGVNVLDDPDTVLVALSRPRAAAAPTDTEGEGEDQMLEGAEGESHGEGAGEG